MEPVLPPVGFVGASKDTTAALSLKGIGKRYGRNRILQGLDLDVAAGETIAILGANGSGKSTLLRVAGGLARPTEGTILISGTDPRKDPEAARSRLSILTQEAPLYPELTPHEHLAWWARAQGIATADVDLAARLEAAGLAAARSQAVRHLSRGQRQRLALAMALLPERPLLLLDEPFSALDGQGRAWLAAELAARRGREAIVLVLHDARQADTMSHRTLRLQDGRLEAVA